LGKIWIYSNVYSWQNKMIHDTVNSN